MSEKNIAVIGAGYWGKNLVRNFHELGVLKTVCDGAQTVRKQISEGFPSVYVTPDMDSVIKDGDIRGVVIASPAALHYQLTEDVRQRMRCRCFSGDRERGRVWSDNSFIVKSNGRLKTKCLVENQF